MTKNHTRWAKSNVRTIKRRKRETAKQIRTLSSFRENAFDVEPRDTNLMIANWTEQANASHASKQVTWQRYASAHPPRTPLQKIEAKEEITETAPDSSESCRTIIVR